MIRSIVIDDEQHCIDSLVADLAKNCSNVEVAAKCTFWQRRHPCHKKI